MVTVPLLDTSIAAPVMEMVFEPPPVGLTIGLGSMVTEPPLSSLTGKSEYLQRNGYHRFRLLLAGFVNLDL